MEQQFTSAQVVRLTGITPRQLQWWDERGIVVPKREGRRRLYSAEDITEIAVICALRRKGFPLQKVRRIMKFLQKELGRRLAEAVSNGSDYHLLTDGKRVYLENSQREVIDVLKNSRQPLLGVCLTDTVREVRAEIFNRRPSQKQGTRGSGRRRSS
jgi:DNA-binding transcriptional MerR regulator